jgi:hypothetical protein
MTQSLFLADGVRRAERPCRDMDATREFVALAGLEGMRADH